MSGARLRHEAAPAGARALDEVRMLIGLLDLLVVQDEMDSEGAQFLTELMRGRLDVAVEAFSALDRAYTA